MVQAASSAPRFIVGTPAADGVALGTALALQHTASFELEGAGGDATAFTIDDYHLAVRRTESQLADFQRRIEGRVEETVSALFRAHLAMLTDRDLSGWIENRVSQGVPVPEAIREAFGHYIQSFAQSPSASLREKAHDLRDLCRRLLANLHQQTEASADLTGRILFTPELLPSDMLRYVAQRVAGIVLTSSGTTAHISMLARSLQVPMVVIDAGLVAGIADGVSVLLDATQGWIRLHPDAAVVSSYDALIRNLGQAPPDLAGIAPETRTGDGLRIRLLVNLGLLSELPLARAVRAEGIGLYRSEMPFLVRDDYPTEEEQLRIYRRLLEGMGDLPVVFRTLDVGGDKMLAYFPQGDQANPFLGLRGIRFSLRHQEVFRTQLRALLRAGEGRRLQIMFPLVSSLDSFLRIREIVGSCAGELVEAGIGCNPQPELGAMIELPSAVGVAEELAEAAAFLSIGTNDLIQYVLAVDRTNHTVSEWYVPYHPSVLRSIKRVVDAAARFGKPVSICGDMACDAALLPVLVGMGVTVLSVPPYSLRRVQQRIAALDAAAARALAARVLASGSIGRIAALLGIPRDAAHDARQAQQGGEESIDLRAGGK